MSERGDTMESLYEMCREVIVAAGYDFPAAVGEMHCLAVRGLYPVKDAVLVNGHSLPGLTHALKERPNILGEHNDVVVVFGRLGEAVGRFSPGCPVARTFPASVDPGRRYTLHPLNRKGCAHLCDGQIAYTPGIHRGHQAFVQAAAVKVWRDGDKDGEFDPGETVETGWFGINLHASAQHEKSDPWSAGCQVIEGGWEGPHWRRLFSLITRYGLAGRSIFTYTLLGVEAWRAV